MSQEILKDGTHVRYFRDPKSDEVLIKIKDNGILHQEWIRPDDKNNFIYIKKAGKDRYILKKSGNYTQIEQSTTKYKDGIDQTVSTNDLYYTDYNGTKARLHKEKGFNGTSDAYFKITGTTTDYSGRPLNYEMITENKRLRDFDSKKTREICNKMGYDKAYYLFQDITKFFNETKEKFINFEEALFAPFKE